MAARVLEWRRHVIDSVSVQSIRLYPYSLYVLSWNVPIKAVAAIENDFRGERSKLEDIVEASEAGGERQT
jgi:hypothetical protein